MLGLRTICYTVDDMDAARDWYSRAFGIKPYFDEPFYIGFNIAGYELGLMPRESASNGNNTLTYWGVDDLEGWFEQLKASGARVHEVPHRMGDPIMVCSVFDPWNNIIGLIYNPLFQTKQGYAG